MKKAKGPNRTKRRMDKNVKPGQKNKLTVSESMLDRKNYEYRFVNDVDNNIQEKESIDWDIARIGAEVGDAKAGEGQQDGSVVKKHVGGGTYAVLMCKKKEWYEDDAARKEERLKEIERDMNDKEAIEQKLKKIE